MKIEELFEATNHKFVNNKDGIVIIEDEGHSFYGITGVKSYKEIEKAIDKLAESDELVDAMFSDVPHLAANLVGSAFENKYEGYVGAVMDLPSYLKTLKQDAKRMYG